MIRIAIIDDHEIVQEALRTVLQSEPDFEVVAESGSRERHRRVGRTGQPGRRALGRSPARPQRTRGLPPRVETALPATKEGWV